MVMSVFIVFIIVFLDQITKYFAVLKLKSQDSLTLIRNFLDFKYIENRGAAFGILEGAKWILILLTIIIIFTIIYYYIKLPPTAHYKLVRLALLLVTGGAIGNLIDRLIKGYVVDFIHATFIDFPIFNVADIFVVTGSLLLAFCLIFLVKDEEEVV